MRILTPALLAMALATPALAVPIDMDGPGAPATYKSAAFKAAPALNNGRDNAPSANARRAVASFAAPEAGPKGLDFGRDGAAARMLRFSAPEEPAAQARLSGPDYDVLASSVAVPLPATLPLLLAGFGALALGRRRRG